MSTDDASPAVAPGRRLTRTADTHTPTRVSLPSRSFGGKLGCSPSDDAVVRAVIDLAHAHDLVVVAEGVETTEQLAALRDMGCDRAQGYLLGRPVRAEAVPAALAAVALPS